VYEHLFHAQQMRHDVWSQLDAFIRRYVNDHYVRVNDQSSWTSHFNQWPSHIIPYIPVESPVRIAHMIRDSYPINAVCEVCPDFEDAEAYFTIAMVHTKTNDSVDPLCDMYILLKVCLVRQKNVYRFQSVTGGMNKDLLSHFTSWLDLWIQNAQRNEEDMRNAIDCVIAKVGLDESSSWGLSKHVSSYLGIPM
jgi:hypothetical protein